jgi:hypothetical protein
MIPVSFLTIKNDTGIMKKTTDQKPQKPDVLTLPACITDRIKRIESIIDSFREVKNVS